MKQFVCSSLFWMFLLSVCYSSNPKNGFVKIRVAQWNIGQLSKGKKGKTIISSQNRNYMALEYSRLINKVRADIFCLNEYAPYFSMKDSLLEDSTDLTRNTLLSMYEDCKYGKRYGANCNCIAIASGSLQNFTTVSFKVKKQHRYYSMGEIEINGTKVKIISTHLEIHPDKLERKAQTLELLELLKNEPYVIICADFNMVDTSEYDIFKRQGFNMANHGTLGDIITCPNDRGYCIDNILCKGFNVLGVDVYKTNLSDHYVIATELIIK